MNIKIYHSPGAFSTNFAYINISQVKPLKHADHYAIQHYPCHTNIHVDMSGGKKIPFCKIELLDKHNTD